MTVKLSVSLTEVDLAFLDTIAADLGGYPQAHPHAGHAPARIMHQVDEALRFHLFF